MADHAPPAEALAAAVPAPAAAGRVGAPTAAAMAELALALASAVTPDEVLDAVADVGRALVGAAMVNISVLDEEQRFLQLLVSRQTPGDVEAEFARYPMDAPLPSTDALRSGRPVLLGSIGERDARYPALRDVRVDQQSFAILPLKYKDRPLGVLGFGWAQPQAFGGAHLRLIEQVAHLCGAALARAQVYRREQRARVIAEEANRRLEVLQDITHRLAEATTPQDVAHVLVGACGSVGASATGVSILDFDDTLSVLTVHGFEEALAGRGRFAVDASPIARDVFRTRAPVIVTSRTDRDRRYPEMAGNGVRQQAWANLPLIAGDRVLGIAAFGFDQPRTFERAELALLTTLCSHAAIAVERTQLLAASRSTAETLQRALLPPAPPPVPGWDIGTRYLPAVEGTQVGGDWFDAFALADGRVGLVLGDVMGKGVHAAAIMGSIRAALRAFCTLDPAPATVLTEVDRYLAQFGGEAIATCCYAVLDLAGGALEYSSAGHPPALVVAPAGQPPRWLDGATSLPLGVDVGASRPQGRTRIAPHEALVLYSDGLVEDRGRSISDGMDRLAAVSTVLTGTGDITGAAAGVVTLLTAEHRNVDDVALLAVRRSR